jgi:hypothetical protein
MQRYMACTSRSAEALAPSHQDFTQTHYIAGYYPVPLIPDSHTHTTQLISTQCFQTQKKKRSFMAVAGVSFSFRRDMAAAVPRLTQASTYNLFKFLQRNV